MEVTRQTLAFTDEQLKTLKATTGAVGTAATRTATASTFLRIQSWVGAKAAKVLTVSLMGVRAALRGILGSIGIGLIFEAVSWIMSLLSKTKEAKEEIKKLDTNIAGATAQAGNAVREMSTLRDAINKAPDHSNQKIALMAQFNKNYGTYIKGLNLETKAVLTQADAYKKLTSALRGKIYTEMEEEDTNQFLKPEMSEAANRWTKYQIAYENAKKKHGNTSLIGAYALLDGSHLRGIVMDEMKKGASVESVMKKVNDSIGSADGLKWMDLLFDGKSGQEMLKSYIRAEFRAENTRRFIAKKYSADDVKKDKANYTLATTPRETMNDARDKEAEREANSAEQTRKRKLKEVVKESDAVIDKIKSYYTRQKTYLNEMFNRGVLEKAQLEQYTSQMEDRQNKTLAVARKAIAKGHTGEWDRYKMTEMGFGQDMFDTSTENLLDDIRHTNVWNIHNRFRRLKGQSELDAIEKNAEKNMAEIAKKETERQQEAAKEIQEYDYTVQVDNKFEKEMVSKGIIKLSMKEALNEYVDMGRDFSKNGTEMMMKPGPMTAMLANARENETAIYGLDMRDISDRDSFMKTMFAGKSYNKFFQEVRELDINNPKDEGKITVFYNHIVDYLDAYTEAQKKETERDRKIFSYKYKRTDAYKENQQEERVLEGEKKLAGITTSLGMTTSEYSQDMELEMLKAKLEAAQDYYSFLAQSKADQMLLEEQQQKINEAGMNLYQKQMEQIQTSLSKLKNWMNPVEKAGEDLGKAVFGSLQDRRNVFVNLMQQYADLTREMILNWVKQRLQQKIHNRLMETNESQHEMSMQTIQKTGDMAKLQMEQTTNTASETAQATHATKTITTEAAETSGKVQLGIVGAAATTLTDLGWWGIPLVAVITALLNAMLAAAMSGVSKLFGGGATASATANTTKITSGMLTYDEGNVQAFAANDGNVYRATPVSHLSTALVTSPIATSVNGQPSLVAEKGPEIVIGRQTTRAMMMNDPALVRTIINYDRYHSGRYRALDNGEIPVEWGQGKENGSIDNTQLIQAITTLNTILANGISAKINKYGAGGLVEEVVDGLNFARRNRMNRNVNRLFK